MIAVALSACMVEPHDNAIVGERDDPIRVSGYYPAPDGDITIQAYNFDEEAFVTVESVRVGGDDSRSYRFFDNDWYPWSGSVSLGEDFWSEDDLIRGSFARLRSRSGSTNLLSVDEDWETCFNDVIASGGTASDFAAQCAAERTPEVHVYTEDFCRLFPEATGFTEDIEYAWIADEAVLQLTVTATGQVGELTGRVAHPDRTNTREGTCRIASRDDPDVSVECQIEFESACEFRAWVPTDPERGISGFVASITLFPDDPNECGYGPLTSVEEFRISTFALPLC